MDSLKTHFHHTLIVNSLVWFFYYNNNNNNTVCMHLIAPPSSKQLSYNMIKAEGNALASHDTITFNYIIGNHDHDKYCRLTTMHQLLPLLHGLLCNQMMIFLLTTFPADIISDLHHPMLLSTSS